MQCVSPIDLKNPRKIADSKVISVPCGKCGACLKNRRNSWTFRLKEEFRKAKSAWFLTLTYDDDHMEWSDQGFMTVRKRTLQLFMKKLRFHQSKINNVKIRYYGVGEYGTKTDRPHYHLLVFNVDKTLVRKMADIWGKGQISVGSVNDASIHYVTKYHVNIHDHPEMDGMREKEFSIMSRKPGIGFSYVARTRAWHENQSRGYVVNNGFKQAMPQYYKDKIFSRGRRLGITQRFMKEADKKHVQRVLYMLSLNNPNPEFDLEIRAIVKAYLYKKKANDKDVL